MNTGAERGRGAVTWARVQALLKTMLPQYKFALVEKLCEDVLGTAAEGGLPLDGCCHSVIADALGVIALPDLQITAKTVAGGDDGDGDDGGEGGTQGGASQVRTPHRSLCNAGCTYTVL